MTVLTMNFQVYILGYIESQCSSFSRYFTYSPFFKDMQFPDGVTHHEKNHKFRDKSIYFWLAFEIYRFHGHA